MSGDTLAVLGVGVTLLAAILTFGFALLGAHRTTQATLNARMDRMDQRMDRMDQRMELMDQRFEQRFDRVEATLNDLRRDVTDIDRRLSRIEGAVLGPWRPQQPPEREPPTEPLPEREARQEPVPAAGTGSPRQ